MGSTASSKAYLDVQCESRPKPMITGADSDPFSDKPHVTSNTPPMQYVPLGLTGRVRCDIEANPPHSSVQWHKDGVKLNTDGGAPEDVDGKSKGGRYSTEDRGAILKIHQVR